VFSGVEYLVVVEISDKNCFFRFLPVTCLRNLYKKLARQLHQFPRSKSVTSCRVPRNNSATSQ